MPADRLDGFAVTVITDWVVLLPVALVDNQDPPDVVLGVTVNGTKAVPAALATVIVCVAEHRPAIIPAAFIAGMAGWMLRP